MTHVRMLNFTRHYKDNVQERLTNLISFCSKFIGVTYTKNYQNIAWFDKVIAKIKRCSFFDAQCRSDRSRVHVNKNLIYNM